MFSDYKKWVYKEGIVLCSGVAFTVYKVHYLDNGVGDQ